MKCSNLGYPRIGENREWKKTLETFWAGKLTEEEFYEQTTQLRLHHLQKQKEKGIDIIPVNDFTFYDHMLDMAVMFGLVPKRFSYSGGRVPLSTYFAMARGEQNAVACEMTKWFNTNYHYIVPELDDVTPHLTENKPLTAYKEAKEKLGIKSKPVLIGPYTFVKLSKGYEKKDLAQTILSFLPLYEQIVKELQKEGVEWVQIDEPALVTACTKSEKELLFSIFERLHTAAPQLNIMLQTYFDSIVPESDWLNLPVQGIGLDFVHGVEQNLTQLHISGFPEDKVLAVGLIDGRNVWRTTLSKKWELIEELLQIVEADRIWLQPSCSLLHVPVSAQKESHLAYEIRSALAFADEKLDEIVLLSKRHTLGAEATKKEFTEHEEAQQLLLHSPTRARTKVHEAVQSIQEDHIGRHSSFNERKEIQQKTWDLPLLPTTTIGSFPQSAEVRQARQKFRKFEWSEKQYEEYIEDKIKEWINIQEDIGLDVLVHGEFERTDMVEFFGEKLGGFVFTKYGWVQSYGSRCVRPPIVYADVEFLEPMTVKESVFAKSLTQKPVKGMLTGPVTILNWSFIRDDISRKQVAYQIALALQQEVKALEDAGINMIQVDEPALREGLPLKKADWNEYLSWAVTAFRLTTSSVADSTQIHTHMCYCEFHDFIHVISELDADVISIETSRSHGELIAAFEQNIYDKGIGLGVYDIHSPRIPEVDEMSKMIQRALDVLNPSQFWINPDCGLKTRGVDETIPSLKNMVVATQAVRQQLLQQKS
ncbi:5-methyltetrahydropteroyltriglutamate--homocysteine S-methyltransferase [Bacillus horti]|uniref:5-methyltetrahydropteroyltriglutamate--homocysteine methyltransferase n=1 Tax=Caldalkalibacillus horti TaxID=77523 RepID=A0ABT9W3P6_9BACI|nr:5-methyltetrahydropteroyltriglutamate--homocysteine S-methyltransferase [Bacillus horti]MDQ0167875.1 5-methyltetrahydropteroyltriglutamate--homocysteine methyltransferase [Bacillus horti]